MARADQHALADERARPRAEEDADVDRDLAEVLPERRQDDARRDHEERHDPELPPGHEAEDSGEEVR